MFRKCPQNAPARLLPEEQLNFFSPNTPIKAQPNSERDTCFRCRQKGHWSRECPNRQKIEKCGFFQWRDDVGKFLLHGTKNPAGQTQPEHPKCLCGAGPCIVKTYQVEGYLKGCQYYACSLKKTQGACSHFEWYFSPLEISETIATPAGNELHHTNNLKYEEPTNNRTKNLPSFQPPTPEQQLVGQGPSWLKRPNYFESSSSKLKCVLLSDCSESKTSNYYVSGNHKSPETSIGAIEAPMGSIVPEPPTNKYSTSPIRRINISDKCLFCGEGGHSVDECEGLAECISSLKEEEKGGHKNLNTTVRDTNLTEKCW